jgi:hypothetical protein
VSLNPEKAALTAINEAISALNYEPIEPLEVDPLIEEAREALMAARERLTDKRWPDQPGLWLDQEGFERWHSEKAAQQRRDGRA